MFIIQEVSNSRYRKDFRVTGEACEAINTVTKLLVVINTGALIHMTLGASQIRFN